MILHFPSQDALRLALVGSGALERVVAEPAEVVRTESGAVSVRCGGRYSATFARDLAPFGVLVEKGNALPDGPTRRVGGWIELLPLIPRDVGPAELSGRAVLFEVARSEDFEALATELLRLGHDRFAWSRCERDGIERTFVRVVEPPYFTVLRLADRGVVDRPSGACDDGRDMNSAAAAASSGAVYRERHPGVWVEWGWELPLAGRVIVPEGEWRLVRAPDAWTSMPAPRLVEIEEGVDFVLPAAPRQAARPAPIARLRVPLRLQPTESTGAASLWVVRDAAIDRLEEFVSASSEELLDRLSFAVVDDGGSPRVLLRSRAGRAPPVVVFEAAAYRSQVDRENLFVPCGFRLVPPVRRGLLSRLFGDDPDEITWLEPTGNGGFRPLSVNEGAFRPLLDWVDYVLDHARAQLDVWSETFACEFDDGIMEDVADLSATSAPVAMETRLAWDTTPEAATRIGFDDVGMDDAPMTPAQAALADDASVVPVSDATVSAAAGERVPASAASSAATGAPTSADANDARREEAPVSTNAAAARLAALEQAFLDDVGPFDSPARLRLWPELGRAFESAGRYADAALCYEHVVWSAEPESPPARSSLSLGDWLRAARRAAGLPEARGDVAREFADLARRTAPSSADALVVAATLVEAASRDASAMSAIPSSGSTSRALVGDAAAFLERFESLLSVRAAWMAWRAVARLSGGDALTLARARDRLLERLHLQGLLPELDLPRFSSRFAGRTQEGADQQARVRSLLVEMAGAARGWIGRELRAAEGGTFRLEPTARTEALARFAFAHGLAVAGDAAASDEQEQAAVAAFDATDPLHAWLVDAYRHRLAEARDGRRDTALPAALIERLRRPPLDRAVFGAHRLRAATLLDTLRRQSRTLDPAAALGMPAWRRADKVDPLVANARSLAEISNRDERLNAARAIRARTRPDHVSPPTRAVVLEALLFHAPSLGAGFAAELLSDVASLVQSSLAPALEIALWERALTAATACDLRRDVAELIRPLAGRFERLLATNRNPQELEPLASLLGRSARGLRKLGLGDAARELADRAAKAIRAATDDARDDARTKEADGRTARASDEPTTALERQMAALALLLRLTPAVAQSGADDEAAARFDEAEAILFAPPASSARTTGATAIGAAPQGAKAQARENAKANEAANDAARPTYRHWLARAWCDTVASLDWEAAAPRLRRFFEKLQGIHRPTASDALYSAPLLSIVESAVAATLSDDLRLDPAARRLLDDAEFTVRRTIHDDVRRS